MEKNVYNIVDIERNVVMKASEEDSSFKKLLAGPARDIHLKFTSEKDSQLTELYLYSMQKKNNSNVKNDFILNIFKNS